MGLCEDFPEQRQCATHMLAGRHDLWPVCASHSSVMRYRAEKKILHIFLLGPPCWWDGPEEESTQSRRKEDEKLFTEELVIQCVCVCRPSPHPTYFRF